jgi:AcrR family transcriptional regulator
MSNGPSAEERKIAVLVAAMQDMHGEIEAMLQKMRAASRAANAASSEVRQAGAAVVPAVTQATAQAVAASMQSAFVDIAEPARKALEAAVKPVAEQFLGLAQRILQLEAKARNAMTWFSAKWIALTAAGFVGMSAIAWASVGWQRTQVNELTAQKTALEADIAEMQANAAALAKKGARIKIVDCGGRLCIVASKNQTGTFSEWHGLWNDAKTGQTMVIPNGY